MALQDQVKVKGTGRVPHVRQSVRGPKKMGVALRSLLLESSMLLRNTSHRESWLSAKKAASTQTGFAAT
jgi:hypothetical protein